MNAGDVTGVARGRYLERYRAARPVVMLDTPPRMNTAVWAALEDFTWNGSAFELADDISVRIGRDYTGYEEYERVLSPFDLEQCRVMPHWLFFRHDPGSGLTPAEKVNMTLLTLWIVRPTKTHVPFRFEEADSGTRNFVRILDRPQWIPGQVREEIRDADLRAAARLLPRVRCHYEARRRLRTAMVLTYRGCLTVDWQVAFVCFAAAAETILTHSTAPRVTDRLSKAYAKLASLSAAGAKAAELDFRRLYRIRSDIVHGRTHDRRDKQQNLRDLAAFSNLLRRLWRRILVTPKIAAALEEADDTQRQKLFLGA